MQDDLFAHWHERLLLLRKTTTKTAKACSRQHTEVGATRGTVDAHNDAPVSTSFFRRVASISSGAGFGPPTVPPKRRAIRLWKSETPAALGNEVNESKTIQVRERGDTRPTMQQIPAAHMEPWVFELHVHLGCTFIQGTL